MTVVCCHVQLCSKTWFARPRGSVRPTRNSVTTRSTHESMITHEEQRNAMHIQYNTGLCAHVVHMDWKYKPNQNAAKMNIVRQ